MVYSIYECTFITSCNSVSCYAHTHSCMHLALCHQIQMQSNILSGGVAVAVSMSAIKLPWEAMTIGFTATVLSTVGARYLKVYNLQMYCQCTVQTHSRTLVRGATANNVSPYFAEDLRSHILVKSMYYEQFNILDNWRYTVV